MNFAPCVVNGAGDGIVLEGGVTLKVPEERRAALSPLKGKPMTFGIRPEHIALGGADLVHAEIVLTEPLGSDTLALLRLGKAEMTGRFPPDSALSAGATRGVTLAMSKFHLFDPETGIAAR